MKKLVVLLTALTLFITGSVAFSPVASALTAPVLSVTGTTETTVSLAWTDAGNETSYRVRRFIGSSYVILAEVPPTVHSYTVAGLTNATTYKFGVTARIDPPGTKAFSNVVTVTTGVTTT